MSYLKLKKRRVFVLFNLLILVLSLSLGNVVFIKPTRACHPKPPTLCKTAIDVVLIMDRSGSMEKGVCTLWDGTNYENVTESWCRQKANNKNYTFTPYEDPSKLQQAKGAAKYFVDKLGSKDQSALVSFSSAATLDKILSNNHSQTQDKINDLTADGATNIGDAIKLATQELDSPRSNPQAAKVEILLTDGRANKPNGDGHGQNDDDVAYAIEEAHKAAQKGYIIFTIGLGNDVNEDMLKEIASSTGGQYKYAPTADDLDGIYEEISQDICKYGSISGCKYIDTNHNGQIDEGEQTLAGWPIILNNDENFTQLTDENGCFKFSGLLPGTYTLSEGEKEGESFVQTYPEQGSYTIELDEEENLEGYNFANYFPTCTAESSDYTELDRVDLGNNTSENYHTISGWSAANLPGNYGGCQQGLVCDYRQVLGEPGDNQCTDADREATVVLHTASSTLSKLIIRHLDGISWKGSENKVHDSFEVYVNNQLVGTWEDNTKSEEKWIETSFDLWQFDFSGDITVKIKAITDEIWDGCPTYGQVSIDWIAVEGCGQAWQQPEPGSITVYKYIDFDGDADTAQDQVLATSTDWTFVLSSQATTTIQTTRNGSTVFTNLLPGQYTVSEQAQDGWITLSPSDDYQITLGDSQNLELTFVNYYPYCGNGVIDEGEECDDGNNIDGDGCSAVCTIEESNEPVCGNGILEPGEECDGQAGIDEGWHCTDECKLEKDGGGGNPVPVCGNGILEAGEECDDGNNIDGDGCSANCIKEDNGGGGGPVCGNGVVEAGEECDDGNTQNGDGCSADCTTESGGGFSYSGGQPIGGGGATGFSTGQTAGTNQTVVLGEEGAPNLSLTKTVNVEFTNPGQTIEYKLLLTNNGNLTAYNVVVTDTLPDGFSFKEGGGQTQTWDFGNLEAGETMAKTYLVVVGEDVKAGTYTNIAQASADNNDPVTAKANVDIRTVEVKGIELPASGFSWPEFMALLALLASTAGLSLYLKREEN